MKLMKKILQKYRDMSLPVKASLWFVACGVLKDAIDVLVTPIFTRILTKVQYGIFNVYSSWFQIVKIIFSLYLFSEVFNVGLVKFEKNRDRFVSATLGFVTALTGFYFGLYLILHETVNRIVGLPWYLVVLLFVHVLVFVPYYCWIRRERYDYQYRNVVVVSMLYVILQPVTALAAILWIKPSINPGCTRVIAAVGVQIVIGTVLYIGMMRRGRTFFDKSYWKYSLKTGIELVPFNLSKVILNQSDRLMINYFSGSGDTAVYSVAHSAAFVLQVVTEALNGAFVPWFYRRLKAREWTGVRNVINGLFVIVSVCVLGVDMIAPEIMKILGSKDYYEGVYCIPPLVFSVFLIFTYSIFTNIELFFGKNIYVTVASSVGMVVNILLNAIFIPKFGIIAASYTTLVGYLTICIGHFIFMERCLHAEKIKVTDLIDLRVIPAVAAVMLLFTVSCVLLYQADALRWAFIVVLLLAVIFTREKWLRLIKHLKGEKASR